MARIVNTSSVPFSSRLIAISNCYAMSQKKIFKLTSRWLVRERQSTIYMKLAPDT